MSRDRGCNRLGMPCAGKQLRRRPIPTRKVLPCSTDSIFRLLCGTEVPKSLVFCVTSVRRITFSLFTSNRRVPNLSLCMTQNSLPPDQRKSPRTSNQQWQPVGISHNSSLFQLSVSFKSDLNTDYRRNVPPNHHNQRLLPQKHNNHNPLPLPSLPLPRHLHHPPNAHHQPRPLQPLPLRPANAPRKLAPLTRPSCTYCTTTTTSSR